MPGRLIPTSRGILGSFLIATGFCMGVIGIGMAFTETGGIQAGLNWLGGYGTDTMMGWAWICAGVLVSVSGCFSQYRTIETAGVAIAFFWPFLTMGLFIIAQATGEHDSAWTQAIRFVIIPILTVTIAIQPDRRPPTLEPLTGELDLSRIAERGGRGE